MAGTLQVDETHHDHEVPDVKARRRRVESDVPGDRTGGESGRGALGVLKEQAAPGELVEKSGVRHGER
jgi:hypothetical protein